MHVERRPMARPVMVGAINVGVAGAVAADVVFNSRYRRTRRLSTLQRGKRRPCWCFATPRRRPCHPPRRRRRPLRATHRPPPARYADASSVTMPLPSPVRVCR